MPIKIKDEVFLSNTTETIGQLSSAHFGAIGINNFGFNQFIEHTDQLGLTDIRFPGGAVAEEGYVVDGRVRLGTGEVDLSALLEDRTNIAFDLTHPELISPVALEYDEQNHLLRDDVATFSEALQLAVTRSVDLTLIIPVERYFSGVDLSDPEMRSLATDTARQDISIFLERLKSDAYNDGVLPDTIKFDIGNEPYANPIEYAIIAEAIISEIPRQLATTDIGYEINYQMGRGSYEFNNLLQEGYFEPYFSDAASVMPELENLSYLVTDSLTYAERQVAIDQMMIAILGDAIQDISGIRHHVLAFNSDKYADPESALNQRDLIVDYWLGAFEDNSITASEIDYYISAWTTNTSDAGGLPYELAGAANTLELFAYFMEMGVNSAAAWGVTSQFRYKDDMPATTVTDRLSDFVSPQAAILQLLSENVMGADFLGAEGSLATGEMRYYYETDAAFTVFVTVGDLPDHDSQYQLDLGVLGDVTSVSVVNLDIADGTSSGETRLVHTDQSVQNGQVLIEFDQDHEVAMLNINKTDSPLFMALELIENITGEPLENPLSVHKVQASPGDLTVEGNHGTDFVFGSDADELLTGGGGRASLLEGGLSASEGAELGRAHGDFIFAGGGNDQLFGFAGNDLLDGGYGDDDLWGGTGFDTFVFNSGHDIIYDFDHRLDDLKIADDLIGGTPLDQWILQNLHLEGDTAVLRFNADNSLTIHGIDHVDDVIGTAGLYDETDHFVF